MKQNKNVNTNTITAVPIQLRTSYGMAYRLSLFSIFSIHHHKMVLITYILFITVPVLVHTYAQVVAFSLVTFIACSSCQVVSPIT